MSKENKANAVNEDDVVDAKGTTAVTVAQETAVSADVQVSGVRLDFPFLRIGQGMSQWKAAGKKPVPGNFYIGRNKDNNAFVADMGKDAGICGIVLQKVDGFKEDRPWQAGTTTAPRRWVIAGTKDDGTPVTEADCLEAAAKEGFSLAPKVVGTYADSGRPIMRANLARFFYLCMLVPLPEDFDSDEFQVFPIGDRLYTTCRYEFDRHYFKQADMILNNIRSRAEFAHRAEPGYKWDINGLVMHLYSTEVTNRQGIEYISPVLEKALRNGKPWEFTEEERKDFVRFLASVRPGTASVNDVEGDTEF